MPPGNLGDGESPVALASPSAEMSDLLSLRLEGPVGGDGRCPVPGVGGRRAAAPIGDGNAGARDDVGEL